MQVEGSIDTAYEVAIVVIGGAIVFVVWALPILVGLWAGFVHLWAYPERMEAREQAREAYREHVRQAVEAAGGDTSDDDYP